MNKERVKTQEEKNPTEPVVDGLRSDVCGVMIERIFLEACFCVEMVIANEGCAY